MMCDIWCMLYDVWCMMCVSVCLCMYLEHKFRMYIGWYVLCVTIATREHIIMYAWNRFTCMYDVWCMMYVCMVYDVWCMMNDVWCMNTHDKMYMLLFIVMRRLLEGCCCTWSPTQVLNYCYWNISHVCMYVWCMMYDVWCMMYDMMYDVWCMMYDVWCMMYDVWCMMYDVWCVMYDVWCMIYDTYIYVHKQREIK